MKTTLQALKNLLQDMEDSGCIAFYNEKDAIGVSGAVSDAREAITSAEASPDATDLLRRLNEWAEHTGGWDAPIWRETESFLTGKSLAQLAAESEGWQLDPDGAFRHPDEVLEEADNAPASFWYGGNWQTLCAEAGIDYALEITGMMEG